MNVVEVKPRPLQIRDDVVSHLETFLALAKSGQLRAVALAGVLEDGSAINQASSNDCVPALIGSVTILQARLINNRSLD